MTNKAIADFANGAPPAPTDDFVFERAGVTFRIPYAALVVALTSAAVQATQLPEEPEQPDEPLVVPGPIGPIGPQGPPGIGNGAVSYIFLIPDEPEDPDEPMIIPGAQGSNGIPGTPGTPGTPGAVIFPDIPDDPSEPMIIPGPTGPQGTAGGGGSSINTLRKTTAQTINSGARIFTDITGLTFPVVNGVQYAFYFYIVFQSTQATTGWKASVNAPPGTLDFFSTTQTVANAAAGVATWLDRHNVTRDDMTLLTATVTANVDLVCIIQGRYVCTQDGIFAARFANELAANVNINVQAGSWGFWF